MLVYEVNLKVSEKAKVEFAGWLTQHILEVLKNKGFKAAHWYFRLPEEESAEPSADVLWTIHYLIEDRASLDAYLKDRANALRQEALDKFGKSFSATRRVLHLLSVAASEEVLAGQEASAT